MLALSTELLEDLANQVLTDYFGTDHFPIHPVEIELFARHYLRLNIQYDNLCYGDEIVYGVTAYADSRIGFPEKNPVIFKTIRQDTILLDNSLKDPTRAPQRAFTIAHECAHHIIAMLKPEYIMVIENNLQYTKKTGIYLGPTKTGKVRALKLAPQCVELLKEWKLEQMRMRLKQGSDWKETGMVFTKDNGEWLHPDSITRWLNNFSRDNGLPHIHPHAFRHTAASTMIANGVDLVTTANELGHANATTTAMIYAHQIAIAKARAADVRAGVFAGRDSKPKGSKLRSKFRGA